MRIIKLGEKKIKCDACDTTFVLEKVDFAKINENYRSSSLMINRFIRCEVCNFEIYLTDNFENK